MITQAHTDISRRKFLVVGGFAIATACCAPRRLFAQQGDELVPGAMRASATANITVQTLRRNISVLLGPGGNIAVLTGPDGKLIVDAEIVTARPNVSAALASINAEPIKQLINTHWHFDHTGGNEWLHQAGASISGAREHAQTSLGRHAGRRLAPHFPGRACGCDSIDCLRGGLHSACQQHHSRSQALSACPHGFRHIRAL